MAGLWISKPSPTGNSYRFEFKDDTTFVMVTKLRGPDQKTHTLEADGTYTYDPQSKVLTTINQKTLADGKNWGNVGGNKPFDDHIEWHDNNNITFTSGNTKIEMQRQ